jgi:hypothetical protein
MEKMRCASGIFLEPERNALVEHGCGRFDMKSGTPQNDSAILITQEVIVILNIE